MNAIVLFGYIAYKRWKNIYTPTFKWSKCVSGVIPVTRLGWNIRLVLCNEIKQQKGESHTKKRASHIVILQPTQKKYNQPLFLAVNKKILSKMS